MVSFFASVSPVQSTVIYVSFKDCSASCLNRSFCLDDEIPRILSDSVQLEKPDPATIKEVRIKLGKHKSVENRKVLRELSADQGAKTMEEEIVIARSVISPSMETRMRESESLRTRAVSTSA